MLGNDALKERIRSIARIRRGSGEDTGTPDDIEAAPPAKRRRKQRAVTGATDSGDGIGVAPQPVAIAVTGVEEFLPGGEWQGVHGKVYVHERLRSTIEKPKRNWGKLGEPPIGETELAAVASAGLERVLFLDLETGGLSSSPVFLAGTMHWNGSDFVLRQYFARHYGEEAALVEGVGALMREFDTLVTFNGKSYDVPFLQNRAILHGVTIQPPPGHLDILHASRRRWRGDFENCKLQTLERHVCRLRRTGDIPSEEVPGLYHDFVRNGDPYRLVPVFHHNMLDVITMVEILRVLCSPGKPRKDADGWG